MDIFDILDADNLANELSDKKLAEIGLNVTEDYETDKSSRKAWEERNAEALKLALQVVEEKSFPWAGASSVKYPLVTIACLQYNARAYPAIIPGKEIAKCRVLGPDLDGTRTERAKRIGSHISYQLTEEDPSWEEGMDRLFMIKPLVGTVFKKTYFDSEKGRICSEVINPDNFVIDYYAKSVSSAQRKTHRINYYENELEEFFRSDYFKRVDLNPEDEPSAYEQASDEAHGMERPDDESFEVLEQHRWEDLDEDGYKEPYIVTSIKGKVVRITPRFDGDDVEFNGDQIARITPKEYFTKYGFIPSPDGSIYDIGFGILLGPTNRAVNSLLRQLIDAGTLSNAQGGLLARSVRVKGGRIQVTPGRWVRTEASPEDLRKGVFPWPVKDPSNVLFSLLSLLIDAGQKIGSTPEIMMGKNPGQNQPATTTMAVLEQGLQVFSAIYKRAYRSLTEELRKYYKLNREYLNPVEFFGGVEILQKDYQDNNDVVPIADPNVVGTAQRAAKAEALVARAMSVPHIYGMEGQLEVERRYLEALQIPGVDNILPKQIQPPPDMEAEIRKAELEDTSKREWFKAEMDARRTMSNIKKDEANVIRTLENVQDQKVRTQLEALRLAIEADHKEAEMILDAIKQGNTGMADRSGQ